MSKYLTRRNIIIGLVVVVVLAFLGVRALRAGDDTGDGGYQTATVERGNLTAIVGATGTVRAYQYALLTWEASGTVEEVNVEIGDDVFDGQVMATLEQSSLPSQILLAQTDLFAAERALEDLLQSDRAQAAAQLALAQAQDALRQADYTWTVRQEGNRASGETLQIAQANLVLAERKVEQAEDAYNHVSGLPEDDPRRAYALTQLAQARQERDSVLRQLNWYTGHPTDIQQALLDAEVAVAQAQVDDAQREWERLSDGPDPAEVAAAEARVAAAQASLEAARVIAPFAGTVTSIEMHEGDLVSMGSPAIGLANMDSLLIDVSVSEVDINRISVGQEASLVFDAMPDQTYTGKVTQVSLVGVVEQGVVNFRITLELTDADELVRPGMTAAVNLVVSEIEDVLLVPNRAVRLREGERVVYVLRGGRPVPVSVRLGSSSDLYSQVLDGDLEEGDQILLNPPTSFEENGFFGGPP
ncbi:MAG: efflux RND transporter periplasmic adaptor subunit [Anaerolineales bacterium]|jgi:HlyD family secretion protein